MSEFAIVSSGDAEKDKINLERFATMDERLNQGICANGCAALEWENAYNANCPECGFHWSCNQPYGQITNDKIN